MPTVFLSPLAGAGFQFFTNSGVPLSGGLIYTYTAGTTTPETTYTTSLGNVANSNPIVLDAAGRTANEVWLTEGISYKLVLKDSTGATVGTYDNINGINDIQTQVAAIFATLAASSGSNLIGFIQAGTGAVARTAQSKMREWFSVKDFGATGDGVTNDTAAIQNAINAAVAAQSANPVPGRQPASIFFPPGSYVVSSTIDATGIGSIIGESRDSVKLLISASIGFSCGNATSFYNLFFQRVSGTPTALNWATGAYLAQVTNCAFSTFTIGLNFAGSFGATKVLINENNFDSCATATKFVGTCTTVAFQNNQNNTGSVVLDCEDCFNFVITGNNFEDYTVGIKIRQQLVESQITGNWFEKNAAASVTPYEDLTAVPGFFTKNFFAANRYVGTVAPVYGVNNVVTDLGYIYLTPSNLSGYADGRTYTNVGSENVQSTAASSFPTNYTVKTQDAVASQTSEGGHFIFRLGAGSNGQPYGAPRPYTDNTSNLGTASYRWATVYAATGTINTSDENDKEQIANLSEAEKAAAVAVKSQLKRFKFKDAVQKKGDAARYHFGTIAQQVEQAFKDNGLNPENYGVFCRDVWYTIVNDKNEIVRAYSDANGNYPENAMRHERLGVRYDELFAFVLASI